MSVAESILGYETRLASVNAKIEKSEQFRALEEGSAQGRFRTEFVAIETLYKERDSIKVKLQTLRMAAL